jgi:hypothetical protein
MIVGAKGADTHNMLAMLADNSMLESTKPAITSLSFQAY